MGVGEWSLTEHLGEWGTMGPGHVHGDFCGSRVTHEKQATALSPCVWWCQADFNLVCPPSPMGLEKRRLSCDLEMSEEGGWWGRETETEDRRGAARSSGSQTRPHGERSPWVLQTPLGLEWGLWTGLLE